MIILASVAGSASAQASARTWGAHVRAVDGAFAAHDTSAWQAALMAMQRAVGTTPRLAARLADVDFALHDSAGAAFWIATRAAMGLAWDTIAASRYRTIRGEAAIALLQQRNAQNSSTIDDSQLRWTLDDADMLAEDVAYDARRHRFLVSSVRRGGATAIDAIGHASVVLQRAQDTWGTLAIGIDSARDVIWLATAAFAGSAGFRAADSGRSSLLEYDAGSGALRRRLEPPDNGAHVLGDLTIGRDGTVYVSDGLSGAVYEARVGDRTLRVLLPVGTFSSPQTPALSRDGSRLFVPDYAFGIASVDLRTRAWHWIQHADTVALTGIDGLYRMDNGLIAVQNGIAPNRITRFALDPKDQIIGATPLVRGGSAQDINHAVIVGGALLFIVNAGWDRMSEQGVISAGVTADAPRLRAVKLR